jgi:hypothetical protein
MSQLTGDTWWDTFSRRLRDEKTDLSAISFIQPRGMNVALCLPPERAHPNPGRENTTNTRRKDNR